MNRKSLEYNRIVIVGNGFDLASGLKTNYCDFIDSYLKKSLATAISKGSYSSILIELNFNVKPTNPFVTQKFVDNHSDFNEAFIEIQENSGNPLSVKYPSSFFKRIIDMRNQAKWVDIEASYYAEVIRVSNEFEQSRSNPNSGLYKNSKHELASINSIMDYLSCELEKYVLSEQEKFIPTNSLQMVETINSLFSSFEKDEVLLPGLDNKNVLFLNFNYTNILSQFFSSNYLLTPQLFQISIHGKAGDDSNDIIFGYGDDTSIAYNKLEELNDDEFLRKIKSFKYPDTHNYHDLLLFLEDDYDVVILGHSCGLSDRTLLKTIFENKFCNAINIFHYSGMEEHFYKRMAISRHFEDKARFRQLVQPYNAELLIRQFDD